MNEAIHTMSGLEKGDELHVTIQIDDGEKTVPLTVGQVMADSGRPKAVLQYDGRNYANLWGYQTDSHRKEMELQTIASGDDNSKAPVTDVEVL